MRTAAYALAAFVLSLIGCRGCPPAPTPDTFGTFEGEVQTEWLDDGRLMRLLDDFHYVDPDSVRWTAPAGDSVDGASIPRGLWTIVGPPLVGSYRKASVIHDVGCVRRTRSMEDTHRAFYYACRLEGVPDAQALLMYWAVSQFAEPWPDPGATTVDPALVQQARLAPSDSAFAAAIQYFEYHADSLADTDLDQLRRLRPAELERRIVRDVQRNHYTIPQRLDTEDLRLNRLPNGFMESRRLSELGPVRVDPRALEQIQIDPRLNEPGLFEHERFDQGRIEARSLEER